jgi:hypothetical protein
LRTAKRERDRRISSGHGNGQLTVFFAHHRPLQKSVSNFCDDADRLRWGTYRRPDRGSRPPAGTNSSELHRAAAAEPTKRFAAAQHRRACVPPFEIIGFCGVALFFAALMFGARQTPLR